MNSFQAKIYDAYLEAPLHQKLELATKMTALAAADLTATGIQIEAYKSPEANINEKFNQIIQANAFRSLADVSFTGFYKFAPLTKIIVFLKNSRFCCHSRGSFPVCVCV